jgi:hypothetical protein
VSRGGIAVDERSIRILDLFVNGLANFLIQNISHLLKAGVSKYFCSYYVATALELLFNRDGMKEFQEKWVSAQIAVHYAYQIPFLLFKHDHDLVLRSWKEHDRQPIVIGRNVYNSLLRSVAFGVVDFPLPKEVIESLPENYLLAVGAEDVIYPMFIISEYTPSAVQYHEPSRGVFVRWEAKAETKSFGGFWLIDFPAELNDVVGINFAMASCLNSRHLSVVRMMEFSQQVIDRMNTEKKLSADKRDELEREFVRTLLELPRHMEREFLGDGDDLKGMIRERFARIGGSTRVAIPSDLVDLCLDARVIRDDLWSFRE